MSLGKSTYVFGATEPSRTTWLVRILALPLDRKSTRLNSSHLVISYAVFCLKKNVLRQLYESHCDLLMGVPVTGRYADDKPRLLFTAPYYVMTQVVVAPAVGGVASLEGLQGKLVGVQAMTLSDQLAYERGWNRKVYLKSEELFAALVSSEVDAVVVESVFAGPFLRKSPGFRAL